MTRTEMYKALEGKKARPKCGATVQGKEDTNVICGDCMEKMLVKTGRDR